MCEFMAPPQSFVEESDTRWTRRGCSVGAASLEVESQHYRLFHSLAVEAGVVTALHPTPEIGGAHYDILPQDRFIWVPFGLRGVLPLKRGRAELSAAAGLPYR